MAYPKGTNTRLNVQGNVYQQHGFTRASEPVKHRLIMAIDGTQKSGKSHFAFSGPEPIAHFDTDVGTEGVIQKWQDDKEIWHYPLRVNIQELKELQRDQAAKEANAAYEKFYAAYVAVLGKARTIITDNATEIWELLRMARFGKLEQVKPHHYGPVNAEYRELIRMAYDQEVSSLILLHKLKKEYVDDKATGNLQRAGFGDTGFLVQINALCYRVQGVDVPECFKMDIQDCRQNPELAEITLSGNDLNFQSLACQVFPGTKESEWI